MKVTNCKVLITAAVLSTGVYFTSCKSKPKDTGSDNPTVVAPAPAASAPAPVTISQDTALQAGLRDATKEFPGVNATVNNGEITLTGDIKRSKLPTLMMALNSLRPKKINNQLTVK